MTNVNEPLVPDVGVLALVYHEWLRHWMTPHHMLTRLSEYFHVVWVNPAREWREIMKKKRISSPSAISMFDGSGFSVYTPEFWLPQLYRPRWLARLTFEQRLRKALRLLTSRGCQKIVLYLWHHQFNRALSSITFDLSCYHIDDEYAFSSTEVPIDNSELKVITSVDHVFVISPGLFEKKGKINPHTTFVPEGVDYKAYATPVPEPDDLAPIPHPRIGYTGVLKSQLDWPILLNLALRHPEWSFVFVGPQAPHPEVGGFIEKLSGTQNVHFLGPKSVYDLAAYPQHFDVCLMPYRLNDYTKYIYPLKLHEYLASGRPVIGTKILSLQEFAAVVSLVNNAEEWSKAISEALSPAANTVERRTARQAVARQYDWQLLVLQIAKAMAKGLGQAYADRLEEAIRTS